jgi:uncharacterized protein DUF1488
MPLKRINYDHRVTALRGVAFWMADQAGNLVFCRISHDALRDQANRSHFKGTDGKVFEAYRDLLEQVASDAFDTYGNDEAGCVIITKEALDRVVRFRNLKKMLTI